MNASRLVRKVARALRDRAGSAALSHSADPAAQRLARAIESARNEARVAGQTAAVERERAALQACDDALAVRTSLLWYGDEQGETITRTVGAVSRASVRPSVGRLLYALVREFEPTSCLELGACLGLSAAYQASALAEAGEGTFVTLEGQPAFADRARETLAHLGLGNAEVVTGPFQDTLGDVLDRAAPVDYAYIDGHHDEQATQDYFQQLLPHLADESVLVFDDINWSEGMRRAWAAISAHPAVAVVADLYVVGVVVVRAGHDGPAVRADLMYW